MYLLIYIFIYLFLCALVYLVFIFALCGLGLYKVSLQVFFPHMIFHCKYLAIFFFVGVYQHFVKIM